MNRIPTLLGPAALLLSLPALAGDVTVPAGDATLQGTTWGGDEGECVVLVHDADGSRAEWAPFARKLEQNGFRALAVDLRGHGDTGGTLDTADYPSLVADVRAAATWMAGQGCESVALVGAGLGANLALNAAAAEPVVDNLVLLSARPNIHGVKVLAASESYQGAVLVVTEAGSVIGVKTADAIEQRATGPHHVREVASDSSGLQMLNRDAELEGVLLSWLAGTYGLVSGGVEGIRRDVVVGDDSHIETSGTHYGSDEEE